MTALDFGMSADDFGLWFGILVLIVVEVGVITPPVGMNLFVVNAMAGDVPLSQTFRGGIPICSDRPGTRCRAGAASAYHIGLGLGDLLKLV